MDVLSSPKSNDGLWAKCCFPDKTSKEEYKYSFHSISDANFYRIFFTDDVISIINYGLTERKLKKWLKFVFLQTLFIKIIFLDLWKPQVDGIVINCVTRVQQKTSISKNLQHLLTLKHYFILFRINKEFS